MIDLERSLDEVPRESAQEIERYFDRLWPIMRSLTGDGVRRSHEILSEISPLQRVEIPCGEQVFDWTIPAEWVFREAYIVGPDGRRFADAREHTLHLVNYSIPFRGRLTRSELDRHLYSIPEQPDAIPYVTSYYTPRWGFCIPHSLRLSLPEGEYEVVVDTEHRPDGSLTLSEAILPGESQEEVFFSTYTCHPSLANNELSGPLVAAFLLRRLAALRRRRFTFRFVWLPETIGSIAYLHRHGGHLKSRMVAGYNLSCIGDPAPFTYMRSRRGETLSDRVAIHVLSRLPGEEAPSVLDFSPDGSDERQYCSPGFDLPLGVVSRSIWASYPQYHTSLDDRNFVSFEAMRRSVDAVFAICCVLEQNRTYRNLEPYGEPQLGRRGLYPTVSTRDSGDRVRSLLWVLNQSDGTHDLLTISERSGLPFSEIWAAAEAGREAGLLETADPAR